jgi:hypothetical protein
MKVAQLFIKFINSFLSSSDVGLLLGLLILFTSNLILDLNFYPRNLGSFFCECLVQMYMGLVVMATLVAIGTSIESCASLKDGAALNSCFLESTVIMAAFFAR